MSLLNSIVGQPYVTGERFLGEKEILDFPWKGTVFENVLVRHGSMTGSQFLDCTFINTVFEDIYLDHVDFLRCHFEGFTILHCSHEGMEMQECRGQPPTIIGDKGSSTAEDPVE